MTTQTIIKKANKLCREHGFKSRTIEFQHYIDFDEDDIDFKSRVELLIFYSIEDKEEQSNFSVTIYGPELSTAALLKKLEIKLLEINLNNKPNNNANKITFKNEN